MEDTTMFLPKIIMEEKSYCIVYSNNSTYSQPTTLYLGKELIDLISILINHPEMPKNTCTGLYIANNKDIAGIHKKLMNQGIQFSHIVCTPNDLETAKLIINTFEMEANCLLQVNPHTMKQGTKAMFFSQLHPHQLLPSIPQPDANLGMLKTFLDFTLNFQQSTNSSYTHGARG